MPRGSRHRRVRPSEVAAHTRKVFLPSVRRLYGHRYPGCSIFYDAPPPRPQPRWAAEPPIFHVENNDPVDMAISHRSGDRAWGHSPVPFICPANETRPGGDWETSSAGYEEALCRRSNLSDTLKTPWPGSPLQSHYPITRTGIIFSEAVVIYRGPPDKYAPLPSYVDLPIVSVVPVSRPRLVPSRAGYAFLEEIDIMRAKMRGALLVCLHHRYDCVVIGDFGLGKCLNPPWKVAEFWRDLFLFDAELRGQFRHVYFGFTSERQNTMQQIADADVKKAMRRNPGRVYGTPSFALNAPTDMDIFRHMFSPGEIQRVLHGRRDPRYEIRMITT